MILKKLSASAVDTADPNSTFGCPRKFHFQYVQGIRPQQDASPALGEAVHKSIEHYLAHGGDTGNALHPIALPAKEIIDAYLPRQKRIEHAFGPSDEVVLTAHGIPFSGRIDLLVSPDRYGKHPWEIVDWKTTSDIARYSKTRGEALKSTQMLTYVNWFFGQHPSADTVTGAFVYMQTRGRKSEKVAVDFTRETAAAGWTNVSSLVKSCADIAGESDVAKVPANLDACNVARGCPFRDRCPQNVTALQYLTQRTQPKAPMSLLERFRLAQALPTTADTAPVDSAPVADTAPPAASPPPQAPATPAPAATPPERPSAKRLLIGDVTPPAPAPEAPRGAGRPKGSKNKVKAEDFKLPATLPTPEVVSEKPIPEAKVTRLVIRKGITLNTGNFNSVRVDAEMEATGEIDAAELGKRVTAELVKQLEELLETTGMKLDPGAKK